MKKSLALTLCFALAIPAVAQLLLLNRNMPNTVNGTGFPNDITSNEMAALWFDGRATDNSGNGNGGITHGSEAYTNGVNGHTIGAMVFNGTNYVTIGTAGSFGNFTNQQFSISLWLKETVAGTYLPISCGKGLAYNGYFVKIEPAGAVDFWNSGASKYIATTSGAVAQTNVFYFLTFTWDATNLTIFVNGSNVKSGALTNFVSSTTYPFTIGINNQATPAYGLVGVIDDVRVWNTNLSAGVVSQLYANSAF
jgi:hypothetical protein